ncbi:hypothetical protein ACIQVK_16555 [Streptomyces sp. NPDC090493]|uniref:hypothetical protein n=1 Tax=Streptomyces sp. NPDC090493 TaxID=3365964 RepID=UPI00381453D7
MPSVVGLLEEHELAARRRVDGLREEADRIQAELAAAEQEWQEWVIARRRVGTVLAPDGGGITDEKAAPGPRDADVRSAPGQAAKAKSQVPVWREGLAWSVLSVDYQRILEALADRHRLHQGPLTCQELATLFGLDAVPAKVEALRSKAKRLVARGWLAERQPGRFTLAQSVAGQAGAS